VNRYTDDVRQSGFNLIPDIDKLLYSPFEYKRRATAEVVNIGKKHVPVVVTDFMSAGNIAPKDLQSIGYTYNETTDKWNIADAAADYIFLGDNPVEFALPGTLRPILFNKAWERLSDLSGYIPLFEIAEYAEGDNEKSDKLNFVNIELNWDFYSSNELTRYIELIENDTTVVLCVSSTGKNAMQMVRGFINRLMSDQIAFPVIVAVESHHTSIDEQLIHFATESGALFLDGMGDGIWLMNDPAKMSNRKVSGRTYLETKNNHQFINNTSFSILQAARTRISKTEYISCPSCGRTLFELQETTAKIRAVTNHLKGIKIAIMGCIVNGPGEMADADFGYVGSGVGKITLYRGKEVVKKNIDSAVAVDELINLLKESDAWVDN
jgi:(E)-4-hydroxy-3-methylbut-2-enyl-diphosphate synthase